MPVRIARLEMADQLDHIGEAVFDGPVRAEWLADFLACPRHCMFIASDGPVVVGMISGVEFVHPDKAPQMWINELGVASTHRRQGIGRRLVAAMLDEAARRGCTSSWLATEPDNEPARRCYASVKGTRAPAAAVIYDWPARR